MSSSANGITFGVVTGQHQLTWDQIRDQWLLAESLGFDSLYLFDHFTGLYGDPEGPCLEASTLLAGLAREEKGWLRDMNKATGGPKHPVLTRRSGQRPID